MGLFFSGNAMDWWPAGVLDYHMDFAYHFTYPHMTIVGDDLLVSPRDKKRQSDKKRETAPDASFKTSSPLLSSLVGPASSRRRRC